VHDFNTLFRLIFNEKKSARRDANTVAPPNDMYANYVVHLKEQSLLKNRWKPRRNRAISGNAMLVRTMHPSNARYSGLGAWQKTNKQKTPHFRTDSRRALCDLSQTFMMIELVVHIKQWHLFFWSYA